MRHSSGDTGSSTGDTWRHDRRYEVVEAGILRKNPKINWNKDRGADPESAPWYPVFKGERINDHHLSLKEKRAAREKKGAKR